MKKNFLLLIICIGIHSCGLVDYTQDFETTIRVVDMSGKPLKGHKVRLYVTYGSEYSKGSNKAPSNTVQTDVNGNAIFNYGLNLSDSGVDFATFLTDDDTIWKVVSYPTQYAMNNKTKKQELKIFMDSLTPIKIRLQKTSTTALELGLQSLTKLNNITSGIDNTRHIGVNRGFVGYIKNNVGLFDSLFVFKVFSKAEFYVSATTYTISVVNGSQTIKYFGNQQIDFNQGQKRDSVVHLMVQ